MQPHRYVRDVHCRLDRTRIFGVAALSVETAHSALTLRSPWVLTREIFKACAYASSMRAMLGLPLGSAIFS
jgi:hypothetical protein